MADDSQTEDKESIARAQLPYRAEYCKTSRAKCKKCSEPMEANSLKLANMTKSRFHDGFDAAFYHVPCFFQIKRPTSVAEIRHFETLKYEDQKMLEEAVETRGLSVLGTSVKIETDGKKSSKTKSKSTKRGQEKETEVLFNYDDFIVEYAKSSRAKCVVCEEKIIKDTVRLAKYDYNSDGTAPVPVPRWHHVPCFAKSVDKLEFYGKIQKVQGYKDLEDEDRSMLKKEIKSAVPVKVEIDAKKVKTEPSATSIEEEKALKKQSKQLFALKEFLNTMRRGEIESMLEFMKQKSNYRQPHTLMDMAADVLYFGPIDKCPVCRKFGGIVLRGTSYICTLEISKDHPCDYETREPKRLTPDVPEELIEKYPFFQDTFRFVGGTRLFPTAFIKATERKEAEDNNIVDESAPLNGLAIGIISWASLDQDRTRLKKTVARLGGDIVTTLDKSVFVILTSEQELAKDSPKIEVAKALNIPFVTPKFIYNIKERDEVVTEVSKCLIGTWDGDLKERYEKMYHS